MSDKKFKMSFDIGTIKHLGLQMYSTLPPVIAELVSNAWDADATYVEIEIPIGSINEQAMIIVKDNGIGMSFDDVQTAYLVVGRDRRKDQNDAPTALYKRKVMGRKGIGKFSAFGIAGEIEVESAKDGEINRLQMNYEQLKNFADKREIELDALASTNAVSQGTKVTLKYLTKYKTRSIIVQDIRRGLARRFAVIGVEHDFQVVVNGSPITPEERDLKRLLQKDAEGKLYLWEYADVEIELNTGWTVSGWIGTLDKTAILEDGIQRGIVIMARGKLVQEPFVFEATVGQQFALSYLVGELYAEFVDAGEDDTISTTRNSLVWDTEANSALKKWGQREVNKVAREWSERRSSDNEIQLVQNPVYARFIAEVETIDNKRATKYVDKLIREVVRKNPTAGVEDQEPVINLCIDYLKFDSFLELAQDVGETDLWEVGKLMQLFREWEVIEAREMMRVTMGRITTIQKLQDLIVNNALEVPTLHRFLKEFPWVLDPRWNLIADEVRYSQLLRDKYPEKNISEQERRIDFLCVREGTHLVVVEIKRPNVRASTKQLSQIEDYVNFMRDYVQGTTDPDMSFKEVIGYLLCGEVVESGTVRQKRLNLERAGIYVRRYGDLLDMVKKNHNDFLSRYEELRQVRSKNSDS